MENTSRLKWAKFILFIAAIYNVFWGAVTSIYPQIMLFGNLPTGYILILIRCIGMLVGVYGIAYYFCSTDPQRYWPLIFVGFVGKVLGPIGAIYYILKGDISPDFLWINVFNDLAWLYPFGWVLYMALTNKLNYTNSIADGRTLYQRFLGEEFGNLSPNLKAFHQSQVSIRVLGEFKVTRGKGIGNWMANLADLPNSYNTAEAELIVTPNATQEIWSRRINDKTVISDQWLEGKLLVEKFKIVRIYLNAKVTSQGDLIIYDVASTVLGIAMPPFFTPMVTASGKDNGDGVAIEVEIGFKPFGRIINYQGTVEIC